METEINADELPPMEVKGILYTTREYVEDATVPQVNGILMGVEPEKWGKGNFAMFL